MNVNRARAIHEAGHACAGIVLGEFPRRVTVHDATGWTLGNCSIPKSLNARDLLCFAAAGGAAEERFNAYVCLADGDDECMGRLAIWMAKGDTAKAAKHIDRARTRAKAIIVEHWSTVEAIAEKLLEWREVNSADLAAIIG